MSELKFKCLNCGGSVLTEIMCDVDVLSVINEVLDTCEVSYGSTLNENGSVDRYECSSCGYLLTHMDVHEDQVTITDVHELVEWLIKNCPQEGIDIPINSVDILQTYPINSCDVAERKLAIERLLANTVIPPELLVETILLATAPGLEGANINHAIMTQMDTPSKN